MMRLWPRRDLAQVRELTVDDLPEALALCALDHVASMLAATRVEEGMRRQQLQPGALLGYPEHGPLTALCWVGVNLVPAVGDGPSSAMEEFAAAVIERGSRFSSLVGARLPVMELWHHLEMRGMQAREIREHQPAMLMTAPSALTPDPHVRLSTIADLDALIPACIAMFTEEVGYSPLSPDGSYERRIEQLVRQGRSYIRRFGEAEGNEPGDVLFKAEVGAATADMVQIQGVWTNPRVRGQGYATAAMAAVVGDSLRRIAPGVSLYVNDYNHAAIEVYRRVGFEQVGEYATVMV